MANDFSIPWQPVDISQGANFFAAVTNANRANDRADEFARMQREAMTASAERQSAAAKRQAEMDKHRLDVERWTALNDPRTSRMANKNPAMFNAGNPYGIKIETEAPPPKPEQSMRASGLNVMEEAANNAFGKHAQQALSGGTTGPDAGDDKLMPQMHDAATLFPGEEGPEQDTGAAAQRFPHPGMLAPGNIDLTNRPRVKNPDGSVSTVRSQGFGIDGREVLLPTVSDDGRNLNENDALAQYQRTGKHLGQFGSPDYANTYAQRLHEDQAKLIEQPQGGLDKAQAFVNKEQAAQEDPSNRRMFASFNGQRFEMPQTEQTLGLGEEYDDLYDALLNEGEDPKVARKAVIGLYKSDQTQDAITGRTKSQITSREGLAGRYRQDVGTQLDQKQRDRDAAMERVIAGGRFKVATANQSGKDEGVNDRVMSLLHQRAKQARETTQYAKLVAADKTVRELFNNIATGSVNLQNRDAQIQLAKYFRGGIPTKDEMAHLYKNLGGTKDAWRRFIDNGLKGALTPEEIRQLRRSAGAVRKEHEENIGRAVNVAKSAFGRDFANFPDMAQTQFNMFLEELGLNPKDHPPLYENSGGGQVGSFRRPQLTPTGGNSSVEGTNALLRQLLNSLQQQGDE